MEGEVRTIQCLGWREWVSLGALGVTQLKAKIDTGARTSALHAHYLETFRKEGRDMVRFGIHPIQKRTDLSVDCEAPVHDQRYVTDSGGHREMRYVIVTSVTLGNTTWDIELTLTNRDTMRFRMLLGRTALHGHFLVDPSSSYLIGTRDQKR